MGLIVFCLEVVYHFDLLVLFLFLFLTDSNDSISV